MTTIDPEPAAASALRSAVRRADPAAERLIDEGCYVLELSNDAADPDVSIARARVPPGVTTRWHLLHGIAERYLILEGRGRVQLGDGTDCEVAAGDVVRIPPGCRQRIENLGPADLIFLAICSPRFRFSAYRDAE